MKFKKKNKTVVALDLGSAYITTLIGEKDPESNEIVVLGVSQIPSIGIRRGMIVNMDDAISGVRQAVAQAEQMAGHEAQSACVNISGAHIESFASYGVAAIRNREVTPADLERVMEGARAVVIPADREILHLLPREYIVDGQEGVKEPIGIAGVRLETRVHIITGALACSQNIVKCLNRCGLMVDDIVFSPLAAAKAVLTKDEADLGVLLIDFGGGVTELGVFRGGSIAHSAVLPIGHGQITADLAAGLRITIQTAEELKCRFGLDTDPFTSRERFEIVMNDGRDGKVVSRAIISDLIAPRLEEHFRAVIEQVNAMSLPKDSIYGVVLVGGGANLNGIVEFAERFFKAPVRRGLPQSISGLTQFIDNAQFAVASGLLVHSLTCSKRSTIGIKGYLGSLLKRVSGLD
ncbi:MAG TPA: cell division protein FtsA [Oligoflexia bacterium]|nr:cell division protein FtsA [Oligoflexia bacterium]HMP26584.1 cell division protein FtsA [Oligoflexia bacterium]